MAHIGDVPEKTLACNHLLRCLQYAVTLHGSRWTSSNSKARMEEGFSTSTAHGHWRIYSLY